VRGSLIVLLFILALRSGLALLALLIRTRLLLATLSLLLLLVLLLAILLLPLLRAARLVLLTHSSSPAEVSRCGTHRCALWSGSAGLVPARNSAFSLPLGDQ
jgi:hypothetical protein